MKEIGLLFTKMQLMQLSCIFPGFPVLDRNPMKQKKTRCPRKTRTTGPFGRTGVNRLKKRY